MRRLAGTALAVVLVAAPLLSPTASAATTVKIDASFGFDGLARQAAPTPLRVLVESEGFFAGVIRVTTQGQNPVFVERPLEIPGGSRKEFLVLLPRSAATFVEAIDRSGNVAGRAVPAGTILTTEGLVGVVSLAAPPTTNVTIPVLDSDARVVPILRSVLDLGSDALRGLTHLVVEGEAAAALSPRQIDAITEFAVQGGDLIVATASESALGFLPAAWRGTGGGQVRQTRTALGTATVALSGLQADGWRTGGAMWSRVLRAPDVGRWGGDDLANGEWLNALGQSGRFRRPTLGWLLAFVLGYVALAGPVNFFVLARLRRRELAWITVPALAVLVAAGAFVIGRGVRNIPITQGVAVVSYTGGGELDTIALGVLSRSGGTERVRLPAGWLADGLLPGVVGGEQTPRVLSARGGVEVEFKLSVGAFGTAAARRFRPGDAKSAGMLTVGNGNYEGTVKNETPFELRNAAVMVGSSLVPIGAMDAGATSPVSIPQRQQPFFSIEQAFFENGFDPSLFPNGNPEGFFSLVRLARLSAGLGEPGRGFLIGLTDLPVVGPSLGVGRIPGSVVVVLPVALSHPAGASLPGDAIPRAVVSTDGFIDNNFGPISVIQNARRSVVRFALPSRTRELTLSMVDLEPLGLGKFGAGGPVVVDPNAPPEQGGRGTDLAVYDFRRGTWRTLEVTDGAAKLDPRAVVSPVGEVLVRMSADFPQTMSAAALSLGAVLA